MNTDVIRQALEEIREECLSKPEHKDKWVRDFCGETATEALAALDAMQSAVDERRIADATNAMRAEILETWPHFKPDVGRLRTIISKHMPVGLLGIPDGYALVPVEPTEEILLAMDAALDMPELPQNELDREQNIKQYRAMIAAAPQAGSSEGWQPIETAPRDGTPIWAWLNETGIRKLRWDDGDEELEPGWVEVANENNDWSPKYWLPVQVLPPPPQGETR